MVLSLIDISNYGEICGFLICKNDYISKEMIQDKINEIKGKFEDNKDDWMIQDIIEYIPIDWNITWYRNVKSICI
ncbi:MAG: hypothetical protein IJ224_12210 [Lachnospiraceae bacterium]|nr:hypothetical protein [Lachnospiraceae bacterium]